MDLPELRTIGAAAAAAGENVQRLIAFSVAYGAHLPAPGGGSTAARWQALSDCARANVAAARVLEAHADALAILAEAGVDAAAGSWGVFAAEAPGTRVDLHSDPGGGPRVSGTKPWCSLGAVLDHALVTVSDAHGRQLVQIDLRDPSVAAHERGGWVARGLRTVASVPVDFRATPARPVGKTGWYVQRPGFAWGGLGVAACWHGGALGLLDTMQEWSRTHDDDLAAMQLGTVDAALHASAAVLAEAARAVDDGRATGSRGVQLALRVRAVVADSVERVLGVCAHALGPAPLAFDSAHAARVADLELYVRQHHAERDLRALGRTLLEPSGSER